MLDIVDEFGEPTGETVERDLAHLHGVRHRTSHVWVYRRVDGRARLLLQKRCQSKDSFPGCYDISSAGHIPAGDGFESSAVRELKEELGLDVPESRLVPCGFVTMHWDDVFHGVPYHDRQVSKVFVLELFGDEPEHIAVQASEVESVLWMDFEACVRAVRENTFNHCIVLSELEMLGRGAEALELRG